MRGESWHLDKRVPVAIILVLIVQILGFGVMWGNLENRVANLETASAQRNELPERIARLEEQIINLTRVLERIETKLDRQ